MSIGLARISASRPCSAGRSILPPREPATGICPADSAGRADAEPSGAALNQIAISDIACPR
jgi:hypothetical protein